MATENIWQVHSSPITELLRDNDLWLDNAYIYEPLSRSGASDDTGADPRLWEVRQFEELQRTDSVPTTVLHPGILSPDYAHVSSIDTYPRQRGNVASRQAPYPPTRKNKHQRGMTPSRLSDREFQEDDEVQYSICSECGLDFENLQGLHKHTKSSSHKAWRCQEVGCGKTYARRDTFLRHRTQHTDIFHPCHVCSRSSKHKVFKRKDHLKEHMRNCHPHSVDGNRSRSDVLSFHSLVNNITSDSMSECGISTVASEGEECSPQQKQAMKDLVRALGTVLGDRYPNIIANLEHKIIGLSCSDMESVAETMTGGALAVATHLAAARARGCPSAPIARG